MDFIDYILYPNDAQKAQKRRQEEINKMARKTAREFAEYLFSKYNMENNDKKNREWIVNCVVGLKKNKDIVRSYRMVSAQANVIANELTDKLSSTHKTEEQELLLNRWLNMQNVKQMADNRANIFSPEEGLLFNTEYISGQFQRRHRKNVKKDIEFWCDSNGVIYE